MIRLEGSVEYLDGRRESFRAGSAIFVAWESYARRHSLDAYDRSNAQTLNHYVAYVALGVSEGFEVWMRDVLDVDVDVDTGNGAVPPTLEGASLASSSSSPLSRDGA